MFFQILKTWLYESISQRIRIHHKKINNSDIYIFRKLTWGGTLMRLEPTFFHALNFGFIMFADIDL